MIKESIIYHTNYLPEGTKINQRCYHIIEEIEEIPLCKECNLNRVNFSNRNKEWRYLDFCSTKCGRINKDVIEKYKTTNRERYGVDNFSKTDMFRKKMLSINREKYGTDWYMTSDDFREKSIKTSLLKYESTSYVKSKYYKDKIQKTYRLRYGVDWYSKSEDFIIKFRKTCLERYGFEHFMLSPHFSNSAKIQFKNYILPSGELIKIQGYENFALDILFKEYSENDILVSNSDIRSHLGVFNYMYEDKNRTYLPDIYIKSSNKIIEVKSKWTYELEIEKNILKRKSCIDNGISFEFWIFNRYGELIII
jgi:hypothetical protein